MRATRWGALLLLVALAGGVVHASCLDAIVDQADVELECASHPARWENFRARYASQIDDQDVAGLVAAVERDFLVLEQSEPAATLDARRKFRTRLRDVTTSLVGAAELALGSRTGEFQVDTSVFPVRLFPGSDQEIVIATLDGAPELAESERVQLALLAMSLQQYFMDNLAPMRAHSLRAIRRAKARWTGFVDDVTTRQLPWEAGFNALLGPDGSIESPPSWQFAVLHPSVAIEIGPEELEGVRIDEITGRTAFGVELFGFQRYAYREDRARMTWGLSAYVSRNEDSGDLGLGPLLRVGGFGDVAVVFRNFEADQWGVVLDVDLFGQLGQILGAVKMLGSGAKLDELGRWEELLAAD